MMHFYFHLVPGSSSFFLDFFFSLFIHYPIMRYLTSMSLCMTKDVFAVMSFKFSCIAAK